jgi:hypothetical protein
MSLRLVSTAEDAGTVEDAFTTLAEVAAVMEELRRFVAECRADPSALGQLTAADLAQAKALLAEARARLAQARRSAS